MLWVGQTGLWAVPTWLVLSGLVWWFNPNYQACKGDLVMFEDQQLCLDTDADRIIYNDLFVEEDHTRE
jgi:hypothetical protein